MRVKQNNLTQQEIIRKLKADNGIEIIDRRSVKANVISLRDMGYAIGGIKDEEDDEDIDTDGYYHMDLILVNIIGHYVNMILLVVSI